MPDALKNRLKMSKFESPLQEAVLGLMVAASELRSNMDRILAESNITGEQFNILRILRGAGPEGHPSGAIGCRMIDRAPDITRRLDALESQGLVSRARSTVDRRVMLVQITEKGLGVLDAVTPKLEPLNCEITEKLSEEDLCTLARICDKLIQVEEKLNPA